MSNKSFNMRESVIQCCIEIADNPMLVQGAGGNISWKENDTLWIKSSGTWLADAVDRDIFVPVDLPYLQSAIALSNFEVMPKLKGVTSRRPSIETFLHAIMPHKVVLHLHAIEVLVHLLCGNIESDVKLRLNEAIHCITVEYHKPGSLLAEAVNKALDQMQDINVVFLQNHGVVIGGESTAEIIITLNLLIDSVSTAPCSNVDFDINDKPLNLHDVQYFPIVDTEVHQLAINPSLFKRLEHDWAVCPDHVVFLGAQAEIYKSVDELNEKLLNAYKKPEMVFIFGVGVFTIENFAMAKLAQIRCYYDIISRVSKSSHINTLNEFQIAELLNWEAEQFRMSNIK